MRLTTGNVSMHNVLNNPFMMAMKIEYTTRSDSNEIRAELRQMDKQRSAAEFIPFSQSLHNVIKMVPKIEKNYHNLNL